MAKIYYLNERAFARFQERNPNLTTPRLRVVRSLKNGMYEMQFIDTPAEPTIHIHELMLVED